jgi:hypothetical protein
MTPCPFDAAKVLGSDPFAGDFGDGERVLRDAVGRVRKPFACHCCAEDRLPGEWARIRTEASDEGIHTYRWCTLCCQAELRVDHDGGDAISARESIGEAIRDRVPEFEIAAFRKTAEEAYAASFEEA